MKNALHLKSAVNFFKKGITLSLLILLNSMASAHTEAPYSKGEDYSTAECTYTLSGTSGRVEAGAVSYQRFGVIITGSCSLTVTSNVTWITITSGASTTSSNDVYYSCSANTTTAERTGTITVGGDKTYTVTQAGLPPPDKYEPNNTLATVKELTPEFIQNASTIFILPANCHTPDDIDYYKINLGTGNTYTVRGEFYDKNSRGGVRYTLDAKVFYSTNGGSTWNRLASSQLLNNITGNLYLKIESDNRQVGSYAAKIGINKVATAGCTYGLSDTGKQAASDAGTGQITVTTTGTSCFWAAASNVWWIKLTSGQGTTGTGSVDYYYEGNTSTDSRTGTITVAGQIYSITQAASLLSPDGYEPNNTVEHPYSFTPTFTQNQNATTINISPANCHNSDDVDIYKISLGTAYTSYTVSGVLYDWGNDRKNYTLTYAKISYSTDGGSSWTTWAQRGGPLSGRTVQSGGVLYLKVEPYYSWDEGSYTAKIDVIGGCTYTLSESGKGVNSDAGTGEVTVTAGNSCPWTAVENASWIMLTSDQRTTGPGKVSYSYTKNTGTTSRTGTITIAGQTYTVTQAAAATSTLQADNYEPNNTPETAWLFTPTFTQNVGTLSISPANCHQNDDVDIYKINLGTAYDSYTVSGALYDKNNQSNNSNYTLAARIYYSIDGSDQSWSSWSWGGGQLSGLTVPGGTLYLKIQPDEYYGEAVGSYAVKIDITGGCTYSLVDAGKRAASGAGSGQVPVIAGASGNSSCPWTAVSNASWITISSGQATGTGSGSVAYSYTENTETYSRTGTITVAGYTYTLTQDVRPLSKDGYEDNNTVGDAKLLSPATFTQNAAAISISPANFHKRGDVDFYKINSGSDSYTVNVVLYDLYNQNNNSDYTLDAKISYSTDATTWSDSKDTYLSGISVQGTLYLKIQPYYGLGVGSYAAKINILKVTADCTYNLLTSNKSVTADAGSDGKVEVTTTSSCAWTAASNASWITLKSDQIITGSGSVEYSYNENMSTNSRTGTLMVADKTFTVTQAGRPLSRDGYEDNDTAGNAYSFIPQFTNDKSSVSISPANCHNAEDVDYYKIDLAAGYSYTVSPSLYDLYSQNNNSNYSLDAKISYSTDRTTWSSRYDTQFPGGAVPAGTLYLKIESYIIGEVGSYAAKIDINRASCTYSLSATSKQATFSAGDGQVTVTSTCAWTATSNAAWITLTSGQSGTGSGSVGYSYTENTSRDLRTGTITIAGQVYTVSQSAAAAIVAGLETTSHVQIFPNPAREYVTLDFSSTDKNYASLKIANVFGQVFYERENPQHKMQIPLKGFSSGLYFIILQGGEKVVVQKLIVE